MTTEKSFKLSEASLELLRIKAAAFGSQSALADAVGMPKPTLQKLLSGDTDPAFSRVARLAQALGLSLDDVVAGITAYPADELQVSTIVKRSLQPADAAALIRRNLMAQEAANAIRQDHFNVPLHDIAVSAGHGAEAIEAGKAPETLGFPKPWLRRIFGDTTNLRVVHIKGDSMEPTLSDGDLLMIDTGRTDEVDGLFVLRLDDQLLVKRIFFTAGSKALISSDNDIYKRYDREVDMRDLGEAEFKIIGRAVWTGKTL